MKNLFITMLLLILLAWISTFQAQTRVVKNGQGNYVSVKTAKDTAHFTGHTFISANDKLYYVRVSKAGTKYKVYIKEN